jgi:thioredoxin 1
MLELLKFHATWCNPCKQLAPVVEQVKQEVTDVTVREIDVDLEPETAASYGVMGVPTLILLKDGHPVQRMSGYQPKERIIAMINSQRQG